MIHGNNRMNGDSNGGFIKKSKDQFLREAAAEIGELKAALKMRDEQARVGYETIEKMKWQIAQLRMGVASLATYAGLTPTQVHEIYTKYCEAEDAKINEQLLKETDAAKTKLREDLAAGKVIEFQQAPNPDAQAGGN